MSDATTDLRLTTVERAFELARLGAYESLPELAALLKRERYDAVDAHLAGPSIRSDLRRSWQAARAACPPKGKG
jgi:hypothetical protein